MKIGILGTGMVGMALATKLHALGHEVTMGSRSADNKKAQAWVMQAGIGAAQGDFAAAAGRGEIVFNCTSGGASIEALTAAGADNLAGKILVDVANPLDFSKGMPPSLSIGNTDSLGELIQRTFPAAKVVKTLNTVNADIMVNPGKLPEETDMFLCGDDADAKARVTAILKEGFGWARVVDLGGIAMSRGTEAYLALWIRMWGALGTANFNVRIVRGS